MSAVQVCAPEISELNQVIYMLSYTNLEPMETCWEAPSGDGNWEAVMRGLYQFIDRLGY